MKTLAEILTGPVVDRGLKDEHPMTEAEARHYLQFVDKKMSKKNRGPIVRRMAEVARNLSPEARELYAAYATAYGA